VRKCRTARQLTI